MCPVQTSIEVVRPKISAFPKYVASPVWNADGCLHPLPTPAIGNSWRSCWRNTDNGIAAAKCSTTPGMLTPMPSTTFENIVIFQQVCKICAGEKRTLNKVCPAPPKKDGDQWKRDQCSKNRKCYRSKSFHSVWYSNPERLRWLRCKTRSILASY